MSQAATEISRTQPNAVAVPGISWPVRLCLAALVLATAFIRPGDVSYLLDEPNLMHTSLKLNHTPSDFLGMHFPFRLADRNPTSGARQVHYGPAPLWIYQLILAVTTDPIYVVEIHTLLLASLTALSLVWLARSMKVTPWLAVIAMLSPWLWIYHRMLWDNPLCIPLSGLSLAAYADFLTTRRVSRLYVIAVCFGILPLVHLMSVALMVPIAGHFLIYGLGKFWKTQSEKGRRAAALHVLALLAIVTAPNVAAWSYWSDFLAPSGPRGYFESLSLWKGWFFPLLGAQDLTAGRIGWGIIGEDWYSTLPLPVARIAAIAEIVSLLGFVAVWAGTIMAAGAAWRVIRRRDSASETDHIAALALAIFLCQCVLDGAQRAYDTPHYFNATWIAYEVFAWLAIDGLLRRFKSQSLLSRLAVGAYASSMIIFLPAMVWKIARDGGSTAEGYGTTLSQQVAAVRMIQHYSSARPPELEFDQWRAIRGEMISLMEMMPAPPGNYPLRRLIVKYRHAYPGDASIVVEDFPPDSQ